MSSGVPPSPPVTIRWSTPGAFAPDEVDDAVELVGHRRAQDDLDAELLEAAREPRRVRVLGVARHDLVADRQDGGEHMTSIREIDIERDASDLVELARETSPTAVINVAALVHRLRTVPERSRGRTWVAEADGRVIGRVDCFLSLFESSSRIAACRVAVREEHRGRGIGSALYDVGLAHARRDRRPAADRQLPRERGGGRLRAQARLPPGPRRDRGRARSARASPRGRPPAST